MNFSAAVAASIIAGMTANQIAMLLELSGYEMSCMTVVVAIVCNPDPTEQKRSAVCVSALAALPQLMDKDVKDVFGITSPATPNMRIFQASCAGLAALEMLWFRPMLKEFFA